MAKPSSTSVLHAFGTFFKGMPADQLADLAPLVTNESDSWADPKQRGELLHGGVRNNPVGQMESASGGGAERMSRDYATPANGDGMVEAYSALSRQLTEQGRRIEAIEKAAVALASYLAKSSGVPLPQSLKAAAEAEEETEEQKAERERRERAEGDSKEKESKKAMPLLDVPALLNVVAGRSRSGVGNPPDFYNALSKGGSPDEMPDGLSPAEAIGWHTRKSREDAVARGMASADILDGVWANAAAKPPRTGHGEGYSTPLAWAGGRTARS